MSTFSTLLCAERLTCVTLVLLVVEVVFEGVFECIVDVEGWLIIYLSHDDGLVNFGGCFVSLFVQAFEFGLDSLAIEIDRCYTPYIATVGYLIAFVVHAVSGATVLNGFFLALESAHGPQGGGNLLADAVHGGFGIDVDVCRQLGFFDGRVQFCLFREQVIQEGREVCDMFIVLETGDVCDSFVFSSIDGLAAKIGVVHSGDVGWSGEYAQGRADELVDFVLVTECFFEIHNIHLRMFVLLYHVFAWNASMICIQENRHMIGGFWYLS